MPLSFADFESPLPCNNISKSDIELVGSHSAAQGGSSDVWKGIFKPTNEQVIMMGSSLYTSLPCHHTKIAIKLLPRSGQSDRASTRDVSSVAQQFTQSFILAFVVFPTRSPNLVFSLPPANLSPERCKPNREGLASLDCALVWQWDCRCIPPAEPLSRSNEDRESLSPQYSQTI